MPPLFETAIRRFCAMAAEMDALAAARLMNYALGFVPLPGLAAEFFATLAPACCQRLRRCACVLAADGSFVLPDRAILAEAADHSDAANERAVSLEPMIASIGLSFAHPATAIPPVLARELGMRRIDASLLTEVLQDTCMSRWRTVADIDFEWLAWALRELNRDAALSKQLPELRKMRLLPLVDGGLGCPDDGPLFELPESVCKQVGRISVATNAFASLKVVHPRLVHTLAKRQASGILGRLSVKRVEAADFVRLFVVGALASPETPASELPHLLGFARSLALQSPHLPKGALVKWLLDAGARVSTTCGEVCVLGSPRAQLQLSRDFWPVDQKGSQRPDFVPVPPPVEWKVLNVVLSPDDKDVDGWRGFLAALGVGWFPAIVPVESPSVAGMGGGDWESPALEALLDELTRLHDGKRLWALAEAVNDTWRASLRARCVVGSDQPDALVLNPEMAQPTRLLTTLRERAWLPAARGSGTDDGALYRPDQLWAPKIEIRELLGDAVPYPCVDFADEIVRVLGIRQELSPETVLPLLTSWSSRPSFSASQAQMARLIHLVCMWTTADPSLLPRLANVPFIWLPENRSSTTSAKPSLGGNRQRGSFYLPSKCVLHDGSDLLDHPLPERLLPEQLAVSRHVASSSGLRCLSRLYDSHFLRELAPALAGMGVRTAPSIDDYVGMLGTIAGMRAEDGAAAPQNITACYRILSVFGDQAYWRQLHADKEARVASGCDTSIMELGDDGEHAHASLPGASGTSDAGTSNEADKLEAALEMTRMWLAKALGGRKVLPTADGDYQTLERIFFYAPVPLPGQRPEHLHWNAPTLQHTMLVQPGPDLRAYEDCLTALYETVLRLRLLTRAVREATVARPLEPPADPLASDHSVWLYAAAGAMQRFLLTLPYLTAEQCEETAHNFRAVSLQHVAELSVCREVVSPVASGLRWVGPFEASARPNSGRELRGPGLAEALQSRQDFAPEELQDLIGDERLRVDDYVSVGSAYYRPAACGGVIERAAGYDRVAHLDLDDRSEREGASTLYVTSEVDSEELAKELSKLLPRNMPTTQLLVLTYVLTHVWEWKGQWSRHLHEAIFKKGDLRWQKQPTLPEGVSEWVVFSAASSDEDLHAEAAAEAEAQMKRAMERERAMLTALHAPPEAAAAVSEMEGSTELAMQQLELAGELDPALASAVQRIRQMMLSRQGTTASTASGGGGLGCGGIGAGGMGGGGGGGAGLYSSSSGGEAGEPNESPHEGRCNGLDLSGAPIGPRPVAPEPRELRESHLGTETARAATSENGRAHTDGQGSYHGGRGALDGEHRSCPPPPDDAESNGSAMSGAFPLSPPTGVHTVEWQSSVASPLRVAALGPVDESDTTEVGRWGERLVYMELQHAHAIAQSEMAVTWVNQDEEAGLPYDLVVTAPGGQVDCYIEVKTTVAQEKPIFDVSLAELDCARRAGSAYALTRVFGAGSESVRIASLRNPAEHLGSGLKLLMRPV